MLKTKIDFWEGLLSIKIINLTNLFAVIECSVEE